MPDSELDDLLNRPALKDLVDEPELLGLFTEDRQELQQAVRSLVNQALEDGDFQGRLADALELAIDENYFFHRCFERFHSFRYNEIYTVER